MIHTPRGRVHRDAPVILPFRRPPRRATRRPGPRYYTCPDRPAPGQPGRLIDQLHKIAGPSLTVFRDLLHRFGREGGGA
jgi:hypothetical protein